MSGLAYFLRANIHAATHPRRAILRPLQHVSQSEASYAKLKSLVFSRYVHDLTSHTKHYRQGDVCLCANAHRIGKELDAAPPLHGCGGRRIKNYEGKPASPPDSGPRTPGAVELCSSLPPLFIAPKQKGPGRCVHEASQRVGSENGRK